MKTIMLLRHAKSSWADESMDDFDRPLNGRGRRVAPRMGDWMKEAGLLPDAVYCSTALRARSTVELITESANYAGPVTYLDELYLAPPSAYVEIARQLSGDIASVMMVAHNPGLEALVQSLTGNWERMPTAALAVIQLELDDWSNFPPPSGGRLLDVYRPKEIGVD